MYLVLKFKWKVIKCKVLHEQENLCMGEAWQAFVPVNSICLQHLSLSAQRCWLTNYRSWISFELLNYLNCSNLFGTFFTQVKSVSVFYRVMMQIVQELCKRPGLNRTGFDMPTIYIPDLNKVWSYYLFRKMVFRLIHAMPQNIYKRSSLFMQWGVCSLLIHISPSSGHWVMLKRPHLPAGTQ